MNNLAPIVLFVYNRPGHTRKTLESLMANDLAEMSQLIIYADGPKENASIEQCAKMDEVRKLIFEKKWCKEVKVVESNKNKGIACSVIDAVTEVVNRYGKIIVLEDDLVLSKGFLKFMNNALTIYEHEEKVMHITGYLFPFKTKFSETFFLRGGTNPWSWGTWKRAWGKYNDNAQLLYNSIVERPEKIFFFNFLNTIDYVDMLKKDIKKNKDRNWDIRWYASVFLNDGYGLWPGKSLVQNIGHDGTGVHCNSSRDFFHSGLAGYINVESQSVIHNEKAFNKIARFYKKTGSYSLFKRFFLIILKTKKVKTFFNVVIN